MRKRAVIVGAGLGGLSAAVHLADSGFEVTVIEKRSRAGGRVRQIPRHGSRPAVDWGQHLLLSCYGESLAFSERLGTRSLLREVTGMTPFVSGPGRIHPYGVSDLPPPFNALAGLSRLTQLHAGERLALVRAALAAAYDLRVKPESMDRLSAATWLRQNGQSANAVRSFWEPLVSATLNTPASEASALLVAQVLDKGFFTLKKGSVPVLPIATLHDVFVEPALKALAGKDGRVLCRHEAKRLVVDGHGRVTAVVDSADREHAADVVILAVPPWDLGRLGQGLAGLDTVSRMAAELPASPIVGVEIWFEKPWLRYPYAGLLGSPIQWVFSLASRNDPTRVSVVMSHADRLIGLGTSEVISLAEEEIRKYFPEARGVGVRDSLVIKEKRATFRGRTGQSALRPACRTGCGNLFLAGDWTATGLPATIEGAIQSGHAAAAATRER